MSTPRQSEICLAQNMRLSPYGRTPPLQRTANQNNPGWCGSHSRVLRWGLRIFSENIYDRHGSSLRHYPIPFEHRYIAVLVVFDDIVLVIRAATKSRSVVRFSFHYISRSVSFHLNISFRLSFILSQDQF